MDSSNIWLAPAKINLFLRITAQRADGMHELQTVFHFIDLFDELKYTLTQDSQITRVSESSVLQEDDLCVRAAKSLQAAGASPYGVQIELNKHIPLGAGLGGASSDAATTLLVLNQLWACGLSVHELAHLGRQLGADVPVFIHGQSAWAEGVGELLTPIEVKECWYLIINPNVHVSTAQMFAHSQLTRNCPKLTICLPEAGQYENVFEPVVRSRYPKINSVFNWLREYAEPFLTGTGACVVASFADKKSAIEIQSLCPDGMEAYVARGLNTSPLVAQLNAESDLAK